MLSTGELLVYNHIRERITSIFDIGTRDESYFTDFEGDVHYFEPVASHIESLKQKPNKNKNAYFNTFGLSDTEETLDYFPKYESFYNRIASVGIDDSENKVELKVKKAIDYIQEKHISGIGFIKLDVEGFELKALKGFEDFLFHVEFIQFEYGGTYLDNNTKLKDVIEHLQKYGFKNFYRIKHDWTQEELLRPIENTDDDYKYCNILADRR
jgi:FkbM family methyltransferase